HGLADEWAPHAAKLALESRAFPYLVYDPDAGESIADCLSLDGHPALGDARPTYTLDYLDAEGAERKIELPVTIADWAATEGRFRKHFRVVPADVAEDDLVHFHDYLALSAEDREEKVPYIYTLDADHHLE